MMALSVGSLTVVVGDLSRVATGSLVAAVWQGVLLAAAAGLGLRLLPKTPASVRFATWFGVFLLVTALPLIAVWPHATGVAHAGQGPWLTLDSRWSLAIAVVWLAASLVRAVTLVLAALRVRALWKRAVPVEMEGVSGLHPTGMRLAQVCASDEVDRPTVIGFFSPKILIPSWLLEKLTTAELEQIVMHEAGHLGRADDWMNLLQKIALVVFPLNPALAWVERRLCFERELAVDERVLGAFSGKAGAAKAYAACLATLAEYRMERRGVKPRLALVLGALGRESELGQRVGRILRRGERMKPVHAKLVLGSAMFGLVAAATGLERCPQVVAFAVPAGRMVAHKDSWRPTHPDKTGMNGAPRVVNVAAHSSRYDRGEWGTRHETLAVTWGRTVDEQKSVPDSAAGAEKPVEKVKQQTSRLVRTSAQSPNFRRANRSISDVEPSQAATGVTQWVMVTSWQDANGFRTVLTTVQSAGNPDDSTAQAVGPQRSQEVYPYAAVAVRDGWLVFQL